MECSCWRESCLAAKDSSVKLNSFISQLSEQNGAHSQQGNQWEGVPSQVPASRVHWEELEKSKVLPGRIGNHPTPISQEPGMPPTCHQDSPLTQPPNTQQWLQKTRGNQKNKSCFGFRICIMKSWFDIFLAG